MRAPTRTLLLAGTIFLLAGGTASADSVFGFSYFGREVLTGDARIEGRAGMGLAYTDSMNASVLQASQLADLERVTIGMSSRFSSISAEDDFGIVNRLGMSTPVIRMGLPLPGRGGLGFGFVAVRSTQWTLNRPFEGQLDFREVIEREGTQFDVPVQVGYRVFDHVRVGAGMHFRRGTVRIRYDVGEWDRRRNLISRFLQQEIRDDTYSGWTPEISLSLNEIGPLSIAGYWMPEYGSDVRVGQSTLRDPVDQPSRRRDTLPQRLGVGTRLQLPARLSFGADFTFEEWSAYKGRTFTYNEQGQFDPGGEVLAMKDESTLRLGLERESARVGIRYTTPVRLGFFMKDWNYQLNGNDVREWGVTLGSGLALRGGLSRIDFAAGYSQVGSRSDNGVTESMWTIVVSVSGAERWY